MNCSIVNYSRGQIKIQQMAFVLVAIMIFFGIVLLFYLSISVGNLQNIGETLREEEAKEVVRKLAGSPEFSWDIEDCSSCIDMDKVFALKGNEKYDNFWDVPFLRVEKTYPFADNECTKQNYPDCGSITLIETENFVSNSAFVALCRYDGELGNKCDLGKIYLGFKTDE
ncbi:hypothetical protein COU62_03445 [Candidatus Pacearchaeota archaeon CG10_big_fil_rev_8_21_14_0_10_35_219]|nr:hypothetical protein [Candidatus Pacearchaeota archaeon]OIO42356.1 MAG: hypothetical protein AUJ63_03725 [Candidatus Pacearchaeota archaeon CG1_02_35_32]PIO07407.1 MAG: hypothetical protein COU62_03445 [Candidatus Pacearchaeota archaeon CG10_big_fil_rev_8_21_14_0_10_35_219]PIY81214.1 MAG: hypothetical protein COY79_02945 [Candidatus Pacearchaeota archaeon CG_4_10_14_0_8_um_filter_35_169]PJA69593.1 MAG: hypothetical protein CO155_04960 [Candidatus Pacearchaeota archaeon CG_4_9_14_3_um_filter_